MENSTIVNISSILIALIIAYYFLKKEQRKNDKYFGKNVPLTKKDIKIIEKYKTEYEIIQKDKRLPTFKRDNFILEDISKLATEIVFDHPIPTKIEKDKLTKGDLVKLIFLDKANIGERMWVEFIETDNGLLKGYLRNDSFDNNDKLNYNSQIWFHPNHIFEIDKK